MSQALSGLLVAAVLAGLWLLGRPRPRLLASTDTSAVAALNRAQITLVHPEEDEGSAAASAAADPTGSVPVSPQECRHRARELQRLWQSGPRGRRQVIELCAVSAHPSCLPWLRQGLRDSDSAVVALAAEAIAPFRGRLAARNESAQPTRLPRNVARIL